MVAHSLIGQPALTVSPCFRLASKSISGASVRMNSQGVSLRLQVQVILMFISNSSTVLVNIIMVSSYHESN